MTTETNSEEIKLLFKVLDAVCCKHSQLSSSDWHPINDNLSQLSELIRKNRKLPEAKSPVGSSDECMRQLVEVFKHTRCDGCDFHRSFLNCDDCCREITKQVWELANKWVNDRKSQKSV